MIIQPQTAFFLGAALMVGLITGCGGGANQDVVNGEVFLRCADGKVVVQGTLEKAQAACATHGGVAPTPTP